MEFFIYLNSIFATVRWDEGNGVMCLKYIMLNVLNYVVEMFCDMGVNRL